MPKQVDHQQRRRQIAEAVWAITATRGLDAVSLRDVALEAGVSMGMVQHYFKTKDDMLLFACRYMVELASERFDQAKGVDEPAPRMVIRTLFTETLPVTRERRMGASVWSAFVTRAVLDADLAGHIRQAWEGTHELVAGQLRRAQELGEALADMDSEREAVALVSLVDGLASHLMVGHYTIDQALAAVDARLDQLLGADAVAGAGAAAAQS